MAPEISAAQSNVCMAKKGTEISVDYLAAQSNVCNARKGTEISVDCFVFEIISEGPGNF